MTSSTSRHISTSLLISKCRINTSLLHICNSSLICSITHLLLKLHLLYSLSSSKCISLPFRISQTHTDIFIKKITGESKKIMKKRHNTKQLYVTWHIYIKYYMPSDKFELLIFALFR